MLCVLFSVATIPRPFSSFLVSEKFPQITLPYFVHNSFNNWAETIFIISQFPSSFSPFLLGIKNYLKSLIFYHWQNMIIIFLSLHVFVPVVVFLLTLCDSKSRQTFWTLLSISTDFYSNLVWTDSSLPLISISRIVFSRIMKTATKGSHYHCGGARGVMVIVVGNGHDDTSSNPGRDWLHFTLH